LKDVQQDGVVFEALVEKVVCVCKLVDIIVRIFIEPKSHFTNFYEIENGFSQDISIYFIQFCLFLIL